jgi:hypothetical protein
LGDAAGLGDYGVNLMRLPPGGWSSQRHWHSQPEQHGQRPSLGEQVHPRNGACAANHYDMAGHGTKAEELLQQAERELHEAVEAAKAAR